MSIPALILLTSLGGVTVVDDVGRTVALPAQPRRIVSTAPSNTAALFALGVGDRVVGVTKYCTEPPEARERTEIGDFSSLDLERIVALEPDLVVTTWLEQRRHVEQLERLGFAVLVLYPRSLAATLESLAMLGRALGREVEAARLIAALERRLASIDRRRAALERGDRPLVFVQLGAQPLYTAGPGSTVHEAIERAGGRNLAADLGKAYDTISREVVIERDPEVVLLGMVGGAAESVAAVARAPGFGSLRAVRSGRVHAVDPALLFHQNHRLVDGIEALFELLHPAVPPP